MKETDLKSGFSEIREKLKQVLDPEIGLNIVDLGLLYGIELDHLKQLIKIQMTFTTPSCPVGPLIESEVESVLSKAFPSYLVLVQIVFYPNWNPKKISTVGMEFLENR